MSLLSDEELWKYNEKGIIPGPDESEVDFLKRARFCLEIREILAHQKTISLPLEGQDPLAPQAIAPALDRVKNLYDFSPDWVPVFFSNRQLPFWQGGCAWIFQLNEDSPPSSFLQMRKEFLYSRLHFGIYHRTEILAHEFVHTGRMMFQDLRFEEILAYQTSDSKFRRYFGPIIESSKEGLWFILLIGLIAIVDVGLIAMDMPSTYVVALWLKMIPLAMVGYGLWRLYWKQYRFAKCLENLTNLYKNRKIALALICRLTDEEIQLFSHMEPEKIGRHIETHKEESLRWRTINLYHQN